MVASDESGGLGYDQNGDCIDAKPQPPPSQHENGESSKQNSILSLTLDEIQSKSGKSFGSMNMDEFLANIWSADENQVSSEQPQPNQGDREDPANGKDTTSKPASLSRQGSFSIPTPLCKKTVDEVWSEIDKTRPPPPPEDVSNLEHPQRQSTIGEITLEDFLVKAGVVQESLSQNRMEVDPIHPQSGDNNNSNMATNSNMYVGSCSEMGNNMITSGYLNTQTVSNLSGNGYAIGGYPIFGQTKMIVGNTSFGTSNDIEKCHNLHESSGTKNKKRIIDGPLEVVVERRQRRMIKNRESAARSRARKQAYTVELEAEVIQLEDENERLKQIVAGIEQKRKQEMMQRKHSTKVQRLGTKLKTMRRTVSA